MRYIITESQLLTIIKEQNAKPRQQSVASTINELQSNFLYEALENNSKKIPMYVSKVRPGVLVQLQGLGLKQQNNPDFFKRNLENKALTNSFSTRMYLLNGIGKDGVVEYIDNVYYFGCGKTESTSEQMLNSVRQGKCANISYQDGETTKIKLADLYVSLRQMVDVKNLVVLLARAANVNENVMAVNYLMKFLNDSANPEDVYVGDNSKDQADEYGVSPSQRYSPSYQELKKIYTPEIKA